VEPFVSFCGSISQHNDIKSKTIAFDVVSEKKTADLQAVVKKAAQKRNE